MCKTPMFKKVTVPTKQAKWQTQAMGNNREMMILATIKVQRREVLYYDISTSMRKE